MGGIQCKHWAPTGQPHFGQCLKGLYGGKPSVGTCLKACTEYDGPSRGMGDTVDKVLTAVTLGGSKIIKRRCGGCRKRQIKWNKEKPTEPPPQ